MEIKLYKNYGLLAHEKEPVYTYFIPVVAAHDLVTVDIPQISGVNEYDEPLVSLDGRDYPLYDVLATVDDAIVLRWYDGKTYHIIPLTEKKVVKHDQKGRRKGEADGGTHKGHHGGT